MKTLVFLEDYSFPPNQDLGWKQIDEPKVELEYEHSEDKIAKLNNPSFNSPFNAFDFNKEISSTIYGKTRIILNHCQILLLSPLI